MMMLLLGIYLWAVVCYARAEDLSLGHEFGIGIRNSRVFSFGRNGDGELGIGRNNSDLFSSQVHLIDEFGIGGIVSVSAGEAHAAAIDSTGILYTWGYGLYGQLGHGVIERSRNVPTMVDSTFFSGAVVIVSCGDINTYAIDSDGSLHGWGDNNMAQLARPLGAIPDDRSSSPVEIAVDSKKVGKVATVSGGNGHVCCITEDERLYCWGASWAGQVGDEDSELESAGVVAPTRVSDVSVSSNKYTQVACGNQHTCALDTTGKVLCFGSGDSGLLGQGQDVLANRNVPTLVVDSWGSEAVERLYIGSGHSCVRTNVGGFWCFGQVGSWWIPEDRSQLSSHGNAHIPIAMKTDGIDGILSFALGHDRTCVKDNEGEIHCYGSDQMAGAMNDDYEVLDFSGLGLSEVAPSTTTTASTTQVHSESQSSSSAAVGSVGSDPVVVTSEVRTTVGPSVTPTSVTGSTTTMNGLKPEAADDADTTPYIVLGATAGALVCAIVFVVAIFKICTAQKSSQKRRAAGAAELTTHHQGTGAKPFSGRSKSASRRSSYSAKLTAGNTHAKRRSVRRSVIDKHQYGQIELSNPNYNKYEVLTLKSDTTGSEYQRGPFTTMHEYDSFNGVAIRAQGDSEYQIGELSRFPGTNYDAAPTRRPPD